MRFPKAPAVRAWQVNDGLRPGGGVPGAARVLLPKTGGLATGRYSLDAIVAHLDEHTVSVDAPFIGHHVTRIFDAVLACKNSAITFDGESVVRVIGRFLR